jgi:1,4-dihydroxy-2-naphthoate polyprenyltransferase
MPAQTRQPLKVWLLATRPFSLTAAVVPVIVGTLVAAPHNFNPLYFLLALLGSILIQSGTNLVNDYYDFAKGIDGPDALGPAGMIQRGVLSARQVLLFGVGCFVAGAVIGLLLVALCGLGLLWLGVASVVAGFFYTGAPVSLAYIGLGELTVFFFMGPVMVLGAYFVQMGHYAWEPFVVSLPIAFLVTAILHANNLRDLDSDRAKGKRTIATFIGRRPANWEYYLLIGGAYAALAAMVATKVAPWPVLIALLTLPAAVRAVRFTARTAQPRKLNYLLRDTAALHMRFGALLAVGLLVALVLPHRLLWQ